MTVFVCFVCDLGVAEDERDHCTYAVSTSSILGMDHKEFSVMECPFGIKSVKWIRLEVPE